MSREGKRAAGVYYEEQLSDKADEITGIEIPVDAGHTVLPNYNPAPVL